MRFAQNHLTFQSTGSCTLKVRSNVERRRTMRILNALIGLGLLMMAVVAIVEVAAPSPGASQAAPVSERLGVDTDRLDMLAIDLRLSCSWLSTEDGWAG